MENNTNELIKLFRERLKYPIITVYGVVLIIYNWDVLAVFFLSNQNIEERIKYINKTFKDPNYIRLWMPLVKALFVSILAPLIMLGLEFLLKLISFKRQNIKDTRNGQILEGKLKLAALEFKIEDEKSGKKSLEELNTKVRGLEDELQLTRISNEQEVTELTQKIQKLEKDVTDKDRQVSEMQEELSSESSENQRNLRYMYDALKAISNDLEGYGATITKHLSDFIKTKNEGFTESDLRAFLLSKLVPFSEDGTKTLIAKLIELKLIYVNDERFYENTPLGKLFFSQYARIIYNGN